jgi:DNA-binding transcriptional LysR family regulator
MQDLEDEIGVELLTRSRRGVTLTIEGKLFLEDVWDLLKRTDVAVGKVRAAARGEIGGLHVGYAPAPTVEILPAALSAFQKVVPRVKILLHDLSDHEITTGLRSGDLELGIMIEPMGGRAAGIQFEPLRHYPVCVALTASHPFAQLKSVSVEKLAAEWIVGFRRKDYPEFYHNLNSIYASVRSKPRISVECDSASSLITEVEAGRGVALVIPSFEFVSGKRLIYRPLTGTDFVVSVGIARATKNDVSPAGEKFCEILRKHSKATPRRR